MINVEMNSFQYGGCLFQPRSRSLADEIHERVGKVSRHFGMDKAGDDAQKFPGKPFMICLGSS